MVCFSESTYGISSVNVNTQGDNYVILLSVDFSGHLVSKTLSNICYCDSA